MDDALRDVAIPSIEFPLDHIVTDGARSPPVRTNRNLSKYQSNKRDFSVMERRAFHAAPAKRQMTLTAFHQSTKSGNHHHASLQSPLEALLQKGRAANKTHSINRSATQAVLPNGDQLERQERDEAREKAAAAAQHRQKLAAIKEQIFSNDQRQQSEKSAAEQEAWNDRASATNKSTFDPERRATLPGAAALHPQPPKPAKPKSHTTKQPQSILKKLGEDAKRSRERQAREKKALNERMRAAEEDLAEDIQAQQEAEANHAITQPKPYQSIRATTVYNNTNDDSKPQTAPDDDGELILEPSTPHPQLLQAQAHAQEPNVDQPQGPFSLNSAAGLQAIQKSLPRPMVLPYDDIPVKTATQRFMGSGSTTTTTTTKTPFKKALKGNPDLLPITKLDLQVYKWRAEKVSWAEVRQFYSELTDTVPPREDTLRARLRQVEKAIDVEAITTEMCQQVIDGDEVAETELNRFVALYSQTQANATPAPFKKIVKPELVRSVPSSVPPTAPPPAARPTQGGKSLDYEAYMSLLSSAAEVYAPSSSDDELDDPLQGSPPAEEDCVHWEYFMQRRDLTSENFSDDYTDLDGETPWKEYNASFDQVGHANAEAVKFLFTAPAGVPEIFKAEEKYTLTSERDSEGMARFDLKTEHGLVQVRVGRRMLTFQDHIMPETKQNWLSKTLYYVAVKTCKKAKDDMFDEAEVGSYVLDGSVYGSLDHANSRAMEEWVKLTVKIRSVNYNEVQCKREKARRELQERFEGEGEGWAFALSVDDDERMVEVVVRALAMQGPRN